MAEQPRPPTMSRWLPPGAFILLGLIWGSSFLWIKIAIDEIPPATLVAYRMSLGALGLLAFLAVRRELTVPWGRQLVPLAILGAINTALPIFLISWGEQFIDSGTAAVLNSLVPIFSLIIAGTLLRTEPVTWLRAVGLLIGFGGAALLASRELALRGDLAGLIGSLAVVVAAISYAVGASFAKYRIRDAPRFAVAAWSVVFAALYMWAVALVADGGVRVPAQADTIVAVLWLGILGSFIAYLCYFFLIEELGATLTTMVSYVFPVVGVSLGVVALGEVLDWRLVLGTILVTLGIGVVSLRYDAAVSRVANRGRG
jgi:drug/metabolite transporter (DMT)-like permease